MASTIASTLALSRPSEKLGTHSTSVLDIREKDKGDERATATCRVSRNLADRFAIWLFLALPPISWIVRFRTSAAGRNRASPTFTVSEIDNSWLRHADCRNH